jgi:LacI family transcriptional regulator
MTVSRVINNSGYISQETRERVAQAIADLGYVPNALARSLRFKQTKTLALILTDITNPFFTTVARGVEDTASEHGFTVMFCNTDESQDDEAEYLNVLVQKQVDGVLLVPAGCTPESVTFLLDRNVPVVLLDRHIAEVDVDSVRGDSEGGAYMLTRHLIELGHQRIAILSGAQSVSTAQDRVDGYQRAVVEAGLDGDASLVHWGQYTPESGEQMARLALAQTPRPTAIFAANNFVAIGALHALRSAGLRVPEDVSLVTFDDLPMASLIDPFLTVVEQPAYAMGERATRLLLDRLAGRSPAAPQTVVLPTELIVRKSSGPVFAAPAMHKARKP